MKKILRQLLLPPIGIIRQNIRIIINADFVNTTDDCDKSSLKLSQAPASTFSLAGNPTTTWWGNGME